MSQTTIPLEFEKYLQNQISAGQGPDMNEMIFAYIPDLNLEKLIDRETGLPDESFWVHRRDIDQTGKLGDNALIYSAIVPDSVPEFTFNALFLHDKNMANSCGMIVYKPAETKEIGMSITKSLLQRYTGAAQIAGITVDAATWQIDYNARLCGMDDDHRLACLDMYGHTAFISGFDVTRVGDAKYQITLGHAYIGGLRAGSDGDIARTINELPIILYADVYRDGTAISKWENIVTLNISDSELSDYKDSSGRKHYIAKIASIDADGNITDERQWMSSAGDVCLSGPVRVSPGGTYTYQITNFNDFSTYQQKIAFGTVERTGATLTVTVPESNENQDIKLTVLRDSRSYEFVIHSRRVDVTTPQVTSPLTGADSVSINPTLTSSDYTAADETDTHESSSWEVSTDSLFTSIIWSKYKSAGDLTSVSLPAKTLELGTAYYARVRHYSGSGSVSEWSDSVQFKTTLYAAGGVINGDIIVGQFEGDWLIVAPATQRGNAKWGLEGIDTQLMNVNIGYHDKSTGKFNTSVLKGASYNNYIDVNGNRGCPATIICRDPWFLPNIQELEYIFSRRVLIDSVDESGGKYTFAYIESFDRTEPLSSAISSTESDAYFSLGINFVSGITNAYTKNEEYWIIPCRRVSL